MIRVENMEVFNFEAALRGMRNPMSSWDKSDTTFELVLRHGKEHAHVETKIGKNDMELMRKLCKAGTEHRKFLRQIFVSMDITAPLYWWKEMDTYKFVLPDPGHYDSNSCSTMHRIAAKEFTLDDFSHEHLFGDADDCDTDQPIGLLKCIIEMLNIYRAKSVRAKDKDCWWQMIQLLPSSYNQRRTVTMNYENVATIIKQRSGHKLDEWNYFILELRKLPYITEMFAEV